MRGVLHTGLLFPSQRSTTRAITSLSSLVPAEEILVISSSHLIHLSADFFSSFQRTPGGETGARGFSHRIVVFVPAFNDENHHLSLISGPGRGNPCNKFFTPYLFSADFFTSLQRVPGSETGARSSSHLILIADGRSEPVLPRYVALYAGREFGRTGGLVVGSVS